MKERMNIGERDPGKFAGAVALAISVFTVVGLSAGHIFHYMRPYSVAAGQSRSNDVSYQSNDFSRATNIKRKYCAYDRLIMMA